MRRRFRKRKLAMHFALERMQRAGGDKPKPAGCVFRQAVNEGIELLKREWSAPGRRGVVEHAARGGQPEIAAGLHRHVVIPACRNLPIFRQSGLAGRLPIECVSRRHPQRLVAAPPRLPDTLHRHRLHRPVLTIETRHDLLAVGGGLADDRHASLVVLAWRPEILNRRRRRRKIILPTAIERDIARGLWRPAQTAFAGDPQTAVPRSDEVGEFPEACLITPQQHPHWSVILRVGAKFHQAVGAQKHDLAPLGRVERHGGVGFGGDFRQRPCHPVARPGFLEQTLRNHRP